MVVVDAEVALGGGEALTVGSRTVTVDRGAAARLGALDGELRWCGTRGATYQATAVELGIGLWPVAVDQADCEYGTVVGDEVRAQLRREPGRPTVWVAARSEVAARGAQVEELATELGSALLVVPLDGALGEADAARVAEFLATH